jgi:hypothetical protein
MEMEKEKEPLDGDSVTVVQPALKEAIPTTPDQPVLPTWRLVGLTIRYLFYAYVGMASNYKPPAFASGFSCHFSTPPLSLQPCTQLAWTSTP